jgi:hypothetical protein
MVSMFVPGYFLVIEIQVIFGPVYLPRIILTENSSE